MGIGLPIAAVLIGRALGHHPAWSPVRPAVLGAAALTWLGVAIFLGAQAAYLPRHDGSFGPEVLIGWPNRLMMATFCAWLLIVAWHAATIPIPIRRG